jgi:DNA-binding NarL/FixJ family response regulator
MHVCDGIQALQNILNDKPTMKVIMLTTFDDDSMIVEALQIGACGYLLKDTDSSRIAAAIRLASQGLASLNAPLLKKVSRGLAKNSAEEGSAISKLSPREIEVLRLLARGKSNKQIAADLFLTEGTVKNYVSRIFDQLGVRNRSEAIMIAQQQLELDQNILP